MSPEPDGNWPLPVAKPEEVGFSAERLARIQPAMQRYINEQKVPNIVTLVARHGKVVHLEAQGFMDFESRRPVQTDSFFRLYSNTKPITGVATMILAEEGRLDINDPVSKFIPAFKNQRVRMLQPPATPDPDRAFMMPSEPTRREITVRDCLRNTSGLATAARAPIQLLTEFREEVNKVGWLPTATSAKGQTAAMAELPASIRERVDNLAKLPLNFHPGSDWEYHVGYLAAGVIIEEASGMSLEQFFRERIFDPLRMRDAAFYLPDGQIDRFPTCYRPRREDGQWQLEIADRPEASPKVVGSRDRFDAGGSFGGLLATIGDYARFGQMLLNGGELDGVRILGRKTVELMTSSHTHDMPIPMLGAGFGFGLGVGVRTGNVGRQLLRSVGSFGWGGYAGTNYLADPKEGLMTLCFSQVLAHAVMPDNLYQEDFERLVYQALE